MAKQEISLTTNIAKYFELTPCGYDHLQKAKELVNKTIKKTVEDDDKNQLFRKDYYQIFLDKGFNRLWVPQKDGGYGYDFSVYYEFLDILSRASLSFAVSVSVTSLIQGALVQYGSKEQKKKFLTPLLTHSLGAFSLSENQAGSDASSIRLSIQRHTKNNISGYLIQGTKSWCTNSHDADIFLIFGRLIETNKPIALIVEKNREGFYPGKKEKKLGLASSSTGELIFNNCWVEASNRIGSEEQGLEIALSQLNSGRLSIAAISLGAVGRCLDIIFEENFKSFSQQTEFTKNLSSISLAHYSSLRSFLMHASQLKMKNKNMSLISSSLKLLASNLAVETAQNAFDMLGITPMGHMNYEVARYFRDTKALQIVEGTNQIQEFILKKQTHFFYSNYQKHIHE